ncbi:50S ribosome-binding GTPase [Erysipelothrix sp. Poltava]|nr:50S ribosome-binding GTPase [Erysipelothrix sp. Poltava]
MILPEAKRFLEDLGKILKESQSGRIMKEGVKTVILGKPNVGKSSILNVLLEEDKAIVTEIAGTTRDLVEGWIRLENVALHLIDTAGLRDTGDRIEQIGIEKSRKALESAELVIVVFDASRAS